VGTSTTSRRPLVRRARVGSDFYYRLLNAGFRIAATGGTDNFPDVWRDPPSGSDRTYVRLDGPLTPEAWSQGILDGRTFLTTGPMLFFEVEGEHPGTEIRLAADAPTSLEVRAEIHSIVPVDSLQILVNGDIVRTVPLDDPLRLEYSGSVEVPVGGWVAARALGPSHPYVGDDYAFAQTSPVYVVRGGERWVSAEDVEFLHATVDAIWGRVEGSNWNSDADREEFFEAVEAARAFYRELAEEARTP
jgi:TolB protein